MALFFKVMTLSVEECLKHLPSSNLSELEVFEIKNTLEAISQSILDSLFEEQIRDNYDEKENRKEKSSNLL
jgi:hypothetical protein